MGVADQFFAPTQVHEGKQGRYAAQQQQQDRGHECDLRLAGGHRLAASDGSSKWIRVVGEAA